MVYLILGNKGSGKTKRLIDLVNAAVEKSNGNVVCIEKERLLTYNINYRARLVETDHYKVSGYDAFYGFGQSKLATVPVVGLVFLLVCALMVFMSTSTKFGKTFLCTDFHFDDIDFLITEKTPPIEYVEKIARTKCKIITPQNTNF